MNLVDSHCHLNYAPLHEDVAGVITRAQAAGVKAFLTISTELAMTSELQQLSEKFASVYYSVGVHPNSAHEVDPSIELEDQLRQLASGSDKVKALGETGLDYYRDSEFKTQQWNSFIAHIKIGREKNLPLVVHSRDAEEDTIEVLREHGKSQAKGVIHCFSGSKEFARAALDLGFFISFSGIITFKNTAALQEIAQYVPEDRLLIETDAPFLAPVPYRGKTNEPAYVLHVAQTLADLRGMSLEKCAQLTSDNFARLFNVNILS